MVTWPITSRDPQSPNLLWGSTVGYPSDSWASCHLCYSVAAVCRLSVTLCIVSKRCVLDQKLLLRAYSTWMDGWMVPKCIWRYINLDLCLDVVSRSCQPLCYIRRWISRKPLEIEAWFQRTINWSCGQWLHVTPKGAVKQYGGLS